MPRYLVTVELVVDGKDRDTAATVARQVCDCGSDVPGFHTFTVSDAVSVLSEFDQDFRARMIDKDIGF